MNRMNSYCSIKMIASMTVVFISIALLGNLATGSAEDSKENAGQVSERMKSIIKLHEKNIMEWAGSPVLTAAVIAQNKKETNLEEIKRIDDEWMKGKQETFASGLQENESGKFLREKIRANEMLYTEAFLCDNKGAVVGEYPKTSDYWQGDEEKFIQCFNNGKSYTGPAVLDDSTQTISVQLSVPVVDMGKTIGVLVVGLKNIK